MYDSEIKEILNSEQYEIFDALRHYFIHRIEFYGNDFRDKILEDIFFRLLNNQNPFLHIKSKMEKQLVNTNSNYVLKHGAFNIILENDKIKQDTQMKKFDPDKWECTIFESELTEDQADTYCNMILHENGTCQACKYYKEKKRQVCNRNEL